MIISELCRYEKIFFSAVLGYGDVPTSRKGEWKAQVRKDIQGGRSWGCIKSSLSGIKHSIFKKTKYGFSSISKRIYSKRFNYIFYISGGILTPYGRLYSISIP